MSPSPCALPGAPRSPAAPPAARAPSAGAHARRPEGVTRPGVGLRVSQGRVTSEVDPAPAGRGRGAAGGGGAPRLRKLSGLVVLPATPGALAGPLGRFA